MNIKQIIYGEILFMNIAACKIDSYLNINR